jgi:tetratricopeptide (TPR) repeat protein
MRGVRMGWVLMVLLCAASSWGQYAAKITLKSDRSWVTKRVEIKNNFMVSESGKATIPLDSVKSIEFRFSMISPSMCEKYFRAGDLESLASALSKHVGPVMQYSTFEGNLGEYVQWLLRAQFWLKDYAGAAESIDLLKGMPGGQYNNLAEAYRVLILLENKRLAEAEAAWGSLNREGVPESMMAYVAAAYALERKHYREAIEAIAAILVFHTRDGEWMPAALALEAQVYMENGRMEQAGFVADELMMSYPGTMWSRIGEAFKKKING